MKFIIKKNSLEASVKNLCRVINRKNTLPILGSILFDVNKDEKTVRLTASDSEIWLNYQLALDDAEEGVRFCVSAEQLQAMMTEVSEQPLSFEATDQKIVMAYDNGWAQCPIEPADEYPMPTDIIVPDTVIVDFNGEYISNSIKRCLFAASKDDLRPVLTGVFMSFDPEGCDIAATNGHIIFRNEIESPMNTTASVIFPPKVANIMPDIIGRNKIDIIMHDSSCRIDVKDDMKTTIQFRCIDGVYPKYKSLMKTTQKYITECNRKDLLSALKAVKPFTPESSQMAILTFKDEGCLDVSGEDTDFFTESCVTIGYDATTKIAMTIGVKAPSLIAILSKFTTECVELLIEDSTHSIIIRPAQVDENDHERISALLMPMLIND